MNYLNKIICKLKLPTYKTLRTQKTIPRFLPAALYRNGKSKSILARRSDILNVIKDKKDTVILYLNGRKILAVINSIQRHPITMRPTHVSFRILSN